jgi:hypothetical protein
MRGTHFVNLPLWKRTTGSCRRGDGLGSLQRRRGHLSATLWLQGALRWCWGGWGLLLQATNRRRSPWWGRSTIMAGLEAAAQCWVKSARGTVLFKGENPSTHRGCRDELDLNRKLERTRSDRDQSKRGKSPAHGTRARVNPTGSCLTRMPSRVGTGTKAGRTGWGGPVTGPHVRWGKACQARLTG